MKQNEEKLIIIPQHLEKVIVREMPEHLGFFKKAFE